MPWTVIALILTVTQKEKVFIICFVVCWDLSEQTWIVYSGFLSGGRFVSACDRLVDARLKRWVIGTVELAYAPCQMLSEAFR